ncbi:carbon-nitrogen hydrolase family protein [uncultured Ferrovibrio sp.]|uniref:carbon-nitrogen hydrolase family protein n=1 Tax=uncultured Ferrovibrio sp. TaxID=1576913 RepID=UPI002612400C|nr:carbon-nitrogen hydrolase family protein [uncultured Ferrovibrio sp.]
MSSLRIASAQYPIGRFDSFAAWHAHVADWVAGAAGQGAELLLFPEYGAMELASMLPEALQRDLTAQISALQDYHQDFVATFAELAKRHDVHIVAPSLPVAVGNQVRNRAYLLSPNGAIGFQEKRQMTRFEREVWGIYGGDELKVFDIAGKTGNVRIGIAICYDIEFPLIAHAMSAAGADLILAPSCTDTMAGANRVQVGARARALENQVYVAVSPTVGLAEWSLAVDVNVGWASILATPDRGFPDDGVIARGELSQPGWIHAELDFAALKAAREETEVFTRKDWDGQDKPSLEVTAIKL